MTLKDKVALFILFLMSLASSVFGMPVIFHIAVLLYIFLFVAELLNYIRGNKNTGIAWKIIGKYEQIYGRFFVIILMSVVVLFMLIMIILSIYNAGNGY